MSIDHRAHVRQPQFDQFEEYDQSNVIDQPEVPHDKPNNPIVGKTKQPIK